MRENRKRTGRDGSSLKGAGCAKRIPMEFPTHEKLVDVMTCVHSQTEEDSAPGRLDERSLWVINVTFQRDFHVFS